MGTTGQNVDRLFGHWVETIGQIVLTMPPEQVVAGFGQVVGLLVPHWVV